MVNPFSVTRGSRDLLSDVQVPEGAIDRSAPSYEGISRRIPVARESALHLDVQPQAAPDSPPVPQIANLDGATFVASITPLEDILSVRDQSDDADQVGMTGSTIRYGGGEIGTMGGGFGAPFTFGADAVRLAHLNRLTFAPAADVNGADASSFAVHVQDSRSPVFNTPAPDLDTVNFDTPINFDVPANQAPVFAVPARSAVALTSYTEVYGGSTHSVTDNGVWVLLSSDRPQTDADTDTEQDLYLLNRVTGEFTLVLGPDGQHLRDFYKPVISADGTKIAFSSWDSTLVPGDTNNTADFFVLDRVANTLVRVSVSATGEEAQGSFFYDDIVFSPDGTMVMFSSVLTGIVPGDTNNAQDIFLKNLVTGSIERISVDTNGQQLQWSSSQPFFSADGTKIGFTTGGAVLPSDTNNADDIYMRDLTTGVVSRLTVDVSGDDLPFYGYSDISFSADGKTMLFSAYDGQSRQVYMLDLVNHGLALVSGSAAGAQGNDSASAGRILPDGIHVIFNSYATNLVPGETVPQYTSGTFLKNMVTGEVTRLSVDADGNALADGWNVLGVTNGGTQLIVNTRNQLVPNAPDYGTNEVYLVTLGDIAPRYIEGSGPISVAPNIQITDDSDSFTGGILNISITGGEASDRLIIATSPLAGHGIELRDELVWSGGSASDIYYDGVRIGNMTTVGTNFGIALTPAANAAAVTALLQAVQYMSVSDNPSQAPRSINFLINDGGPNGVSTFTQTLNVVAINDAPSSANATVSLDEDGSYTFSIGDFAYGDSNGNPMAGVVIATLPAHGALTLYGTAVFEGQFVARSDLERLTYTPAADGSGDGFDGLTFKVRDTGGTANGGHNLSGAYTITFNVTPVNDAPVFNDGPSTIEWLSQGAFPDGADFTEGAVSPDGNLVILSTYASLSPDDTDALLDFYIFNRTTGTYTRIGGLAGDDNGFIGDVRFSPDGTKIAFIASYDYLVDGDTNVANDLFTMDIATGEITRVSVGADGSQGNGVLFTWFQYTFTPDGQSIVFTSALNNLIPGEDDGGYDVYIKNLTTGAIERISVDANGERLGLIASQAAFVSPDGKSVGFVAYGPTTPDGDDVQFRLFIHDIETGALTQVTLPGAATLDGLFQPSFSPDGTKILFNSGRQSLVDTDGNGASDIYIYDLVSNTLTLVSVGTDGTAANAYSEAPRWSPDGRSVIFYSAASNLIPGEVVDTDQIYSGLFIKNLDTGEVRRLSVDANGMPSNMGFNVVGFVDGGATLLVSSYDNLVPGDQGNGMHLYQIALSAPNAHYVDGQGGVLIAPALTVTDADDAPYTGGSLDVQIAANGEATDVFSVRDSGTPGSGIEVAGPYVLYNGVMIGARTNGAGFQFSFNDSATIEAVQALIQAIEFSSNTTAPSTATRDIIITLNDGQGGTVTAVRNVDVQAVNDAPLIVNLQGDVATFTEGGDFVRIDTGAALTITDADSLDFNGATLNVHIVNSVAAEDMISFTVNGTSPSQPGYQLQGTGLYFNTVLFATFTLDPDNFTLTFNANATAEIVQGFMRRIVYSNMNWDNPSTDQRTIEITLTDGDGGSTTVQSFVDVQGVNDLSSVTTSNGTTGFTEDSAPIVIDNFLNVSDIDSPLLFAAKVAIDNGYQQGSDALALSATDGIGDIIAVFNAATGVLELTSEAGATLAEWQAALRSVTFVNTSNLPSTTDRSISYATFDGEDWGDGSSKTVTVVATNDAPTAQNNSVGFLEGGSHTVTLADIGFADIEGNAFVELIVDGLPGQGTLLLDDVAVEEGQAISAAAIAAGKLSFVSTGWGQTAIAFRVRDDGGTANGGTDTSTSHYLIFDVERVNDNPVLTLDYETGATSDVTVQERGFAKIAFTGNVVDDSPSFVNGRLIVSVQGATTNDVLRIGATGNVQLIGNMIKADGVIVGEVAGGNNGVDLIVTFNDEATPGRVARVLQAIEYGTTSHTPPETRTISVSVSDGEGGNSNIGTATVHITPVDDNPVAVDDQAIVFENAVVMIDILGNESDVDGGAPPQLASINGTYYISTGIEYRLSSGAKVTINADGTINYDPNGAFNWLVSPETAALTGATNYQATDSFYYTLVDGSRARVDILVKGVDGAGDRLVGSTGDDVIVGRDTKNYFDLSGGGSDTATGGIANDGFYMGDKLDANDRLDGGGGTDNQLGLKGNVNVALGDDTLKNIQTIVMLSANARDGASGYSYNITMADGNVGAGKVMTINANQLEWRENVHFDGSAETDGAFIYYAGQGDDVVIGGAGNDAFFFGNDGRFDEFDRIDGGAGSDQLGLRGDYSFQTVFQADTIKNIETIVLMSAYDTRYGIEGNGGFAYDLKLDDANLAAGQLMIINGNALRADEWITFDGSAETDGRFKMIGGAGEDWFTGGAGDDQFYGRGGADVLTGGGGDDTFFYRDALDSTTTARDLIADFNTGDRIDLSEIDANLGLAGNNSFAFIGDAEFGQVAGQLRAYLDTNSGNWLVEGDIDGDGIADISIEVRVADGHNLGLPDFIL